VVGDVAPRHVLDASDQQTIDQALQLVAADAQRLATHLRLTAVVPLTPEELRQGPLGQDLVRLSLVARGRHREAPEAVLTAVEAILHFLFWPAGADEYTVPRSFWQSDLGQLLARAKLRAFEPQDLLSIGEAARRLGVTRPTIYRWMDERVLDSVRDETSGRTFVVRRDVERIDSSGTPASV
jgi:excisionase family DNA binding protein